MNSIYDLFLLLFTLSQMRDKEKIIELFHESLKEVFSPFIFIFSLTKPDGATYYEEVSTKKYSYGYISSDSVPTIEVKQLLQNAVQMLAVILEKLQFESELEKRTETLEDVDKKRLIEIQEYVKELENTRLGSLNLIEELEQEIQERNLVEKALNESNVLIQNIIDNSPSLIYLIDLQAKFILANKKMEVLFGLKKDELIGKFRKYLMPEEIAVQHWNNDLEVINTKQAITVEEENVEADGKHYYLTQKFPLFDSNNRVSAIGGISTDITDRKQAEDKLRETNEYLENLFNYANAPIIVWDADFKITRFNNAFMQLSGFNAEDVLGKKVEILFPKDKIESSYDLINKTAVGENWETVEIEVLRADGEIRIVLWNSANIYDANQKNIIATIAQGNDITERKFAEESIQQQLEELRRWYNLTLDRECRVIELKQEVNELLQLRGEPLRYKKDLTDNPNLELFR